jgi:3-methyladenine DNA glycosylase AlkD
MRTATSIPLLSSRANALLSGLFAHANPRNVAGMARYGIVSKQVLGIPMPYLRGLARDIKRDHELALELWSSGVYEARILAALIADPKRLTRKEMNAWTRAFDNWAVCDGVCIHLFRRSPFAHDRAVAWSSQKKEFVRRAGFVMMATLAVHDKKTPDEVFRNYLARIARTAGDDRNFVKKAVNWALRQIGKRNRVLLPEAIRTAESIASQPSSSAHWIAADALRELRLPALRRRLARATASRGTRRTDA